MHLKFHSAHWEFEEICFDFYVVTFLVNIVSCCILNCACAAGSFPTSVS